MKIVLAVFARIVIGVFAGALALIGLYVGIPWQDGAPSDVVRTKSIVFSTSGKFVLIGAVPSYAFVAEYENMLSRRFADARSGCIITVSDETYESRQFWTATALDWKPVVDVAARPTHDALDPLRTARGANSVLPSVGYGGGGERTPPVQTSGYNAMSFLSLQLDWNVSDVCPECGTPTGVPTASPA